MGFKKSVLGWIAKWVEDRKQRGQLNGHRSGWAKVRRGVPQRPVFLQSLLMT